MISDEADNFARKLKGHFQKMTDEQVLRWAEFFERFEIEVALEVVNEYIETARELCTPDLLKLLKQRACPQRKPDRWRDKREFEESERVIEEIVGPMTDAEFKACVKEAMKNALDRMTDNIKKLLESGGRSSPICRAYVAEWILKQRG